MLAHLSTSPRVGIRAVVSRRTTNFYNRCRSTSSSAPEPPIQVDIREDVTRKTPRVQAMPSEAPETACWPGLKIHSNVPMLIVPPRMPPHQIPLALTREEIDKYIFNMLSPFSHGWTFMRGNSKGPSFVLSKVFLFKTYKATVDFVNTVADMAKEEELHHHPHITMTFGRVEVSTITPRAVPPGQEPEAKHQRRASYLTLRDMRLAVLVENMFAERFLVTRLAQPKILRRRTRQTSKQGDSDTDA